MQVSLDTILSFIVGGSIFLGGSIAYFRFTKSSVQDQAIRALQATLEAQDKTIASQKDKIHVQDVQIARLEGQLSRQDALVHSLEASLSRIPDWTQLHMGTEQLAAGLASLTNLMRQHEQTATDLLAELKKQVATS